MRIDAGRRVVGAHDADEALDVVAQALRRHRRILDERQRLGVVLHRHRQSEAGFPQAPDARLCRRIDGMGVAVAEAIGTQVGLERLQAGRQVLLPVAIELDAQQRPRVAVDEAAAQRLEGGALAGVVEQ
jgi:hypothetical protein